MENSLIGCKNNLMHVSTKRRTLFTARRYKLTCAVYVVVICPSVRLYVRPSQAGIALTGPDESSWFLARKLPPSTYPTLCCTETWVFPKIMVSLLPFGTFVLNSGLRKFRHGKSVALSSAVELVDDTYATIGESWLLTTSRSTVTL